ncbi:hypothetical protein chiPu_0025544, partial [Chiloscyllium punctatum]|nr:hypothetical protein [Chiloscyllium punctatum]
MWCSQTTRFYREVRGSRTEVLPDGAEFPDYEVLPDGDGILDYEILP